MLTNFFVSVAKKDSEELEKIKSHENFSISKTHWRFTLPELFNFLQLTHPIEHEYDYLSFRKAIFKSRINQTIKRYDAEVTITNNLSKVDDSEYSLNWESSK